jgi:hypothetical protein
MQEDVGSYAYNLFVLSYGINGEQIEGTVRIPVLPHEVSNGKRRNRGTKCDRSYRGTKCDWR